MCGGAILSEFLRPDLYDLSNRECSCILENDETLLRFGKRSRIASQSPCFSCAQVNPHSHLSSIDKLHPPRQDTGSLKTEISNKRRENNCNNSGKRKLCDRNVNLADNLEYCWPTLTKSSKEEDSNETSDSSSDSSSDSETYSGPS